MDDRTRGECKTSVVEVEDRDALILSRLRSAAGQFVSGTELAQLLGVSRAAVGKRVTSLRHRGEQIEAVPNRGYRLVISSEVLSPAEVTPLLRTAWLGRLYLSFAELISTSDEASRMAAEGAPHGTVVVADQQTGGRGRGDHSWYSPPGENLYLSVILRPELAPRKTPPVSLAAAVGIAEAVRGYLGRPPVVKWPNDILVDGRKLCGILAELTTEADRVKHVVLGVGLNVNMVDLPPELVSIATSLKLAREEEVNRVAALAALLNSLEPWLDRLFEAGPAPVIEAYKTFAPWLGSRVSVRLPGGDLLSGVAQGLDADGALLVQDEAGAQRRVVSGEMQLGEGA